MHEGSEVQVAIIGAGFGGIAMAAQLKRAGRTSFVILDKADSVGGTWRDNTYPGAACDVPSHLYSYSFSTGHGWSSRFSAQPEILRYLEKVATDEGLAPHLRLGREVLSCVWDAEAQRWMLELSDGEVVVARAVVSAVGQLNRPGTPKLPELESFEGATWHSARWNHDYDLTGKRVAVIGTGASAIQFVPEIAGIARQVDVYQRSAPYVIPRPDRRYGDKARTLLDTVPGLQSASRLRHYLQYESRALALITFPALMKVMYKRWEWTLRRQVADPELRRKLTPDYEMGCKRILISNDWYPTLCRDDVEVIDTGIERIAPRGVVTKDGREHPADVIIFGTGFRTLEFLQPMSVTGRDGRDLHGSWHEGAEAYLGTTVAGFPNFFLIYGPNTNLVHNSIIYMIESQVAYIADALRILERDDLASLEVREDAQHEWNEALQRKSHDTLFESGCSSWYTTASGRNTNNWVGYTFDYRRRTRHVDLADYVVTPRRDAPAPVGAGA